MEKHRERYWELCLTHLRDREERVALPVSYTCSQVDRNTPRSSLIGAGLVFRAWPENAFAQCQSRDIDIILVQSVQFSVERLFLRLFCVLDY